MCNCNDDLASGGITFPGFTRYACCNPCCDGSVSAQRVDSDDTDHGCCHCCCPCCCCKCCCHHPCDCGNVGGVNDDNNIPPCPCRGGW